MMLPNQISRMSGVRMSSGLPRHCGPRNRKRPAHAAPIAARPARRMSRPYPERNAAQRARPPPPIARARNEIAKSQRKIAALERKGKNLRRNKKGEFDKRSKLGKQLNKDLKRIHVMAFRHNNEGQEANRDAEAILEIPRLRALPWIKSEATRITNRLVLIGFTVTLFTMPLNGWDPSENWFYIISSWGILFYVIMRIFRRRLSTRLEPVFLN